MNINWIQVATFEVLIKSQNMFGIYVFW
jgi:hypothetical protein